jgi:hypothetical protein
LRHRYGSLSTSALGLVLLYAGSLQRASMNLMMRLTELETEFVSVERVADFARIEGEEHIEDDLPNMEVDGRGFRSGWRSTGRMRAPSRARSSCAQCAFGIVSAVRPLFAT